MSVFRFVLVASLVLAPSLTLATPIASQTPCPNCSEAQMRSKALQVLPNSPGVFSTHVYSLPSNVIRNLEVECVSNNLVDPGEKPTEKATKVACKGTRVLTQVTNDPNVKAYFDALRQFWVETGGAMQKTIVLPAGNIPGIPGSTTAFDVAGSWQMQGELGNVIAPAAMATVSGVAQWLGSHFDSGLGFSDGMKLEVELTFSDGSKCKFRWESPNDSFEFVSGSAYSAGGQRIPEQPQQATNAVWTDPNRLGYADDLRPFIQHLQRLGISVYRADGTIIPVGTVSPGPVRRLECRIVNGNLKCEVKAP